MYQLMNTSQTKSIIMKEGETYSITCNQEVESKVQARQYQIGEAIPTSNSGKTVTNLWLNKVGKYSIGFTAILAYSWVCVSVLGWTPQINFNGIGELKFARNNIYFNLKLNINLLSINNYYDR